VGDLTFLLVFAIPAMVIMAVLGLYLPKEQSESWNETFIIILALGFLVAPVLWAVLAFRYAVWNLGADRIPAYGLAFCVTGFSHRRRRVVSLAFAGGRRRERWLVRCQPCLLASLSSPRVNFVAAWDDGRLTGSGELRFGGGSRTDPSDRTDWTVGFEVDNDERRGSSPNT
jgi:hypothetical protein